FWHTLKEDGSKYKFSFMPYRKELIMNLDDFRMILHLPQDINNNHDHFVPASKFSNIVPFYINNLSFTLELGSPSNFKTTGLIQPWQILCKIFSRCLTIRVTGFDQPPLQIMHMLYCFVNNTHVDYDDLFWEGLHYSLEHPSTLIPYLRFAMIIMITDEMKLTEHYRMYAVVFRVDVPTTQSQPIESTQGTNKTISALRSPNPDMDEGESSALRKSTKSHDKLEVKKNVQKFKEHLIAEEIEKLVEGIENAENVRVDSYTLRQNDNQNDPDTRSALITRTSINIDSLSQIRNDYMFGVDVPTTQSQPIESTQGTNRTISALRSPNPDMDEGESSALRKSTVIR
nr:hypothetical protein [Tanacetum cinerariifolium]